MIPFSDCRRCMEAPRKSSGHWFGSERAKIYPDSEAVCRMPASLGLSGITGHSLLWKCPDCGTYYCFDPFFRGSWPQGSCQWTLWRLTPAEAMKKLGRADEGTPAREELRRHQEGLPEWMRDMQACLDHSNSAVRERAAQALASHFRLCSEWAGVTALLGSADAAARRGALLGFDPVGFVSTDDGVADIVPDLLKSLSDPDASVARQAFVLLSRVQDQVWSRLLRIRGVRPAEQEARQVQEQILDQVNAIPAERRTAAARMFLSTSGSFDALVAGFADSEKEVRQCAYYHALKVSLGNTPLVTRLRATLRTIPESDRSWEMNAYLAQENPDEWPDDD